MRERWQWGAIVLVALGTLGSVALAFAAREALGVKQWFFYGGGVLVLAGVLLFRRRVGQVELRLEAEQTRLEADRAALAEEQERFTEAQSLLEKELKEREVLLSQRQEQLRQRLTTFQEWMEFPQEHQAPQDGEETAALFEKDHEVMALLEKEAKRLFDNIAQNSYHKDGEFQRRMLLDEVVQLLEAVARIYHPDSENPLLETSIEQLLRAIHRISLQLLVLLEQLPLDLKQYNLKETYEYVRMGVKAYNVYKGAAPYLTYAKPAVYLGRLALGASPITLGVGWALQELVKTGAKSISKHYANRYALNLLHDAIGIIGIEAATIFGGDIRHRDPGWIYGTELTELLHRFPLSRETLRHGLNELGLLQLRNEYDRIYLYRCVAAHQSATPARFGTHIGLTSEEREDLAKRLEGFFSHYIHGRKPKEVLAWKEGVERRLNVKLRLEEDQAPRSEEHQHESALRSLASFALDIKAKEAHDLPALLAQSQLLAQRTQEEQNELLTQMQEEPPYVFDYPDLEPTSPLLQTYLDDLMNLTVQVHPHDLRAEQAFNDVLQYFREESKTHHKALAQLYVSTLTEHLVPESPEKKVKPHVARNLLAYLEEDEQPRFLYADIQEEAIAPSYPTSKHDSLWLLGTTQRLLLIVIEQHEDDKSRRSTLLWHATREHPPTIHCLERRFVNNCELRGGTWNEEPTPHALSPSRPAETQKADESDQSSSQDGEPNDNKEPRLIIAGHTMTRYETRFACLHQFCTPHEA